MIKKERKNKIKTSKNDLHCLCIRTSCIRYLAQEVTSAFQHYLSFLVQIILLRKCTNATNIQMHTKWLKKREQNLIKTSKNDLLMLCIHTSCIRFLAQEVTSAFRIILHRYIQMHTKWLKKREQNLIKTSKHDLLLMHSHIMYQISGTGSHKRLSALLIIPCPDNSST